MKSKLMIVKKAVFVLGLLALFMLASSCRKEAQQVQYNGAFKVEFLFEHDGCRMYRFYDGRWVYWSDCRGKIQADYTRSNGKSSSTVEEETITTR